MFVVLVILHKQAELATMR